MEKLFENTESYYISISHQKKPHEGYKRAHFNLKPQNQIKCVPSKSLHLKETAHEDKNLSVTLPHKMERQHHTSKKFVGVAVGIIR